MARNANHPRTHRDTDLDGSRANPTSGTVDQQRVAGAEPSLRGNCIVCGDKDLGDRGDLLRVEVRRHVHHAALMDGDAIGETATTDEAVRTIANLPLAHLRPDGLDHASDLESRNIGGPAGRCRIVALALRDVGTVDAGECGVDENLFVATDGIGPLLTCDNLIASSSRVRDATHALLLDLDCKQRTRTRIARESDEQWVDARSCLLSVLLCLGCGSDRGVWRFGFCRCVHGCAKRFDDPGGDCRKHGCCDNDT